MTIEIYDTNLSYRLFFWVGRVGFNPDWWYDVSSRKRHWMPLEFQGFRQQVNHAKHL